MSLECAECERDLRGGHDEDCSIGLKRKLTQSRADIAVLRGMILEHHDRSHGSPVDTCAATLCRQYVAERERAAQETSG